MLTRNLLYLMDRRFTVYKDADLFDFINAPVGKGLPVTEKLRPLIAGSYISRGVLSLDLRKTDSTNHCRNWVGDYGYGNPGHNLHVLQDWHCKPCNEAYARHRRYA